MGYFKISNRMYVDSFISLLKLGLLTSRVSEVGDLPFAKLKERDWISIKAIAEKQGVSAIIFDGLDMLINRYGREKVAPDIDTEWWLQFVCEWIGTTTLIEQKNKVQQEVMDNMASYWVKNKICVMVMKGHANATMYPQPDHRSPGDIDCYLFDDYALGNDLARQIGAVVNESWYKHSVIGYCGETIENHQYFVYTRNGKRGKMLEKELEEGLKVEKFQLAPLTKNIVMPPPQWTAMFLTYHACAHFLSEGLRLKQLLDWAMFLEKHQNDVDWSQFYAYCERNHLRRFADAITSICVNYLGIKVVNPIVTTHSAYADKIINNVIYDDDYIFNSGKSGWMNRLHIVRNLFRYRWKYEEIYQESIYKQLWYYVIGFLFKTE